MKGRGRDVTGATDDGSSGIRPCQHHCKRRMQCVCSVYMCVPGLYVIYMYMQRLHEVFLLYATMYGVYIHICSVQIELCSVYINVCTVFIYSYVQRYIESCTVL